MFKIKIKIPWLALLTRHPPGCYHYRFGLWGRMAKHLSNRGLAGRDAGVSDSATQGLGRPRGRLDQ